MTEGRTTYAARVEAFLDSLKNADWLGPSRRRWPDFVYHFTDVRNVVSILTEGELLARYWAENQNLMATDNASHQVLAQTNDDWKYQVRLYFRPRTPMQFHNEGFRPLKHRSLGAHCPMPIFFLFDSQTLLSLPNSRFSDGNLASPRSQVLSTIAELEQMPFADIYHDSPIVGDEDRIQQITSRRLAEVIVPHRLDLSALRFIVCRSEAERETLLHLLTPELRTLWQGMIQVDPQRHLFLKRWLYVETVELSDSSITLNLHLSANPEHNGPFRAAMSIVDMSGVEKYNWSSDYFTFKSRFVWRSMNFIAEPGFVLNERFLLEGDSVQFLLDDQIAYAGRYQAKESDDLPW